MDNTKLTDDEIKELTDIQRRYHEKLVQFGELYLRKIEIETASNELTQKENEVKTSFNDLSKEEQIVMDKLHKKYGDGSVNQQDWTFVPQSK